MAPPFLNEFLSHDIVRKSTYVPRRKHQKSRSGCTTCKRRHIRCDEGHPRCQNCIIHRSTCSYPEGHSWASTGINSSASEETRFTPPSSARYATKEIAINAGDAQNTPSPTESSDAESRMAEPSFHSLDPYSSSMVPMTATRRDLLTFCESTKTFL